MKSISKYFLLALTALTVTALSVNAQTDSTKPADAKPATKAKANRGPSYDGKVTAVDADGKTVTIAPTKGGDPVVLHVTSKLRIKKDGEPATMTDVTVGEHVWGTYHKDASGNMNASTLNIGEHKKRAAAAPAAADSNK